MKCGNCHYLMAPGDRTCYYCSKAETGFGEVGVPSSGGISLGRYCEVFGGLIGIFLAGIVTFGPSSKGKIDGAAIIACGIFVAMTTFFGWIVGMILTWLTGKR